MYENQTFTAIMERMLERVSNDFDKREGSVIYDALAPAAVELSAAYAELDNTIANTFAWTCSREFLLLFAQEHGITPKAATPAVIKLITTPLNVNVPLESVFTIGNYNYTITAKIRNGQYEATCDTPGTDGGNITAAMTPVPVVEINGLETVTFDSVIVEGAEEEDTESLRKRYMETLKPYAFGGNVADYKAKVLSIDGVGAVKVFRAGTDIFNDGRFIVPGGYVHIYILDNNFMQPNAQLINKVQNILDPDPGMGKGLAPIGHCVNVYDCTYNNIDIEMLIETNDTTTSNTIIEQAIREYFTDLHKTWADSESGIQIRRSKIEEIVMALPTIIDCEVIELRLDGIGKERIATLDPPSLPALERLTINGRIVMEME